MTDIAIKIEHLNYIYSPGTAYEKHALRDICLEIPHGEFVGIIGHTGSGKSTLIQHLNGLVKATDGALYYNGENIYQNGYDMRVLNAVEEVNEYQKNILFEKFEKHFNNDVAGRRVAIWGLAFKPETDDMREAPSLVLINSLLKAGCKVCVYDPIAMKECQRRIGNDISYARDMYEATIDADTIFHVTEWKEFRMPNWKVIKEVMKPNPILIDGRNVFSIEELEGFTYYRIG